VLTSGHGEPIDDGKNETPLWVHAQNVLRSMGNPLTPTQIADILQKSGVEVANPSSLRVAMFRKSDVFRSDGNGRYGLLRPPDAEPEKDEEDEEIEPAGPFDTKPSPQDAFAQSIEISDDDDDIPF
jgi:hypothetical protein